MSAEAVVRRFEVHADDEGTLATVKDVLRVAAGPPPREIAPLLLEGRLSGRALEVSKVLAGLRLMSGVRISHDRIKVQEDRRHGPNGHVYPDRGALFRMGVEPSEGDDPVGAKAIAADGKPVIVAIVDSGITVDHPILREHLWTGNGSIPGKRFIDGASDGNITDEDGHGTMLAGVVIAAADRAPVVRIMTVKFFDAATPALPNNAAAAIDYAVESGAHIINLSWSVGLGSAALEAAVQKACACEQTLVVIAAGNYGSDNDRVFRAPPKYAQGRRPTTITVMATDADDEKAWFSNYGEKNVDLAAPGVGIVSTRRLLSRSAAAGGLEYRTYSGTSAAAALVSGAAARLKARNPGLSAAELKECRMAPADELPSLKRKCHRGGRLNLGRALEECG
jgi:thermitase